jgi:hypothetical protein
MTEDGMALVEFVGKCADGDLLREFGQWMLPEKSRRVLLTMRSVDGD